MTDNNKSFEEPDRPQPRYQPPAVSGNTGNINPATPGFNQPSPQSWPSVNPEPAPPNVAQGAWGGYNPGGPVGTPPNNFGHRRHNGHYGPYGYNSYNSGYIPPAPPSAGFYSTPPQDPQAEAYRQAVKRVNARLAFYRHLATYVIVNAFLWGIAIIGWLSSGHHWGLGSFWPIWITVFWGIGLLSQAWQVFGMSDNRRQQMIEEELRRINRR
ncbi:MAG TPA: 2TM domain-containing protein [Chloroflexia bacterium]|nr:2TM domain-containing protein [Chloroflexia bacterium]